ncbi:MAG TPA: class II fructose-bisphosphate aldolase [Galbitalea sp.]|jgi:ketose-bisphosphate aldolase
MTRSTLTELLRDATATGRGLGAFNVVLLEHAEAIVAGAEAAGRPVVLQISENCIRYHGALAPITVASRAIADAASVPVVVHLDHIEDEALVREGIALGVDSVMFDASKLDYAANVERTRAMVGLAHANGVAIEAELGEVGGKDGVHAAGARTDPREASEFVVQTGVDALAVAVGTSHAMQSRVASVDRDLIERLHAAVPVPLVLHGSSGLSDDELTASIAAGMTKINISTHLNGLFTGAVRSALAADAVLVDPRKYVGPGRSAIAAEVARLLTLLAG